jgi:hypothetical protein
VPYARAPVGNSPGVTDDHVARRPHPLGVAVGSRRQTLDQALELQRHLRDGRLGRLLNCLDPALGDFKELDELGARDALVRVGRRGLATAAGARRLRARAGIGEDLCEARGFLRWGGRVLALAFETRSRPVILDRTAALG